MPKDSNIVVQKKCVTKRGFDVKKYPITTPDGREFEVVLVPMDSRFWPDSYDVYLYEHRLVKTLFRGMRKKPILAMQRTINLKDVNLIKGIRSLIDSYDLKCARERGKQENIDQFEKWDGKL
jgi:hypothetical protein